MPLRMAYIVIAAALCNCNFRIRFERCFSTVFGLTPSSRAIALFELPSAIRVSTSRSRPVMLCPTAGAAAGRLPEKCAVRIRVAVELQMNWRPELTERIPQVSSDRSAKNTIKPSAPAHNAARTWSCRHETASLRQEFRRRLPAKLPIGEQHIRLQLRYRNQCV
jgi:hypothetical protein